jgi:hypothetical protein
MDLRYTMATEIDYWDYFRWDVTYVPFQKACSICILCAPVHIAKQAMETEASLGISKIWRGQYYYTMEMHS